VREEMRLRSVEDIRALLRPWRHRQRSSHAFGRIARWMHSQPDCYGPVMYDVGARWGVSHPYNQLSSVHGFRSISFEPDPIEAEKLQKERAFHFVCPVALGARQEQRTLHIAKDPGSSSLHRPNGAAIARHTTWKLYETVREMDV